MTTETNAERLREIVCVIDSQVESVRKLSVNDMRWLIHQAELAEKLTKLEEAKFRFYNNGFEEDRWALQEENIRMREALEFYADKNIYTAERGSPKWIVLDEGNNARQALKGESE